LSFRLPGVQRKDLSRLREIQPLARILVYYMENQGFPENIYLALNIEILVSLPVLSISNFMHCKFIIFPLQILCMIARSGIISFTRCIGKIN